MPDMETPSVRFRFARTLGLLILNAAVAVSVHLAWTAGPAQKPVAPAAVSEEERLVRVIAKASPAVVSILVEKKGETDALEEVGRGTGFLVDSSGLIVTNRHVAGDREATYTVVLSDE